ncbi:MAG: cupredoxin domain-containing protein [Armatimonadota bacterium]
MRHSRWAVWITAVLAGIILVILTGCPPQTAQETEGEDDQQVAGTEEQVTTVDVGLTEFAIALDPDNALAGDVVFNVRNNGDVVHAFEVEGQGIEQSTPRLQPGETATLRIANMQPGTYEVYCPVGNHAERGMRDTFTVTEAGGQTGEQAPTGGNEPAGGGGQPY